MPEKPGPIADLDEAAALLRTRSRSLLSGYWRDRPWRVEECFNEATDNCPCIVAQGEPMRYWGVEQEPLVQYVADAETTEHADWIAMMHPGMGPVLAAWLEDTAKFLRGVRKTHGEIDHQAIRKSRHQLRAAKMVLGRGRP